MVRETNFNSRKVIWFSSSKNSIVNQHTMDSESDFLEGNLDVAKLQKQ